MSGGPCICGHGWGVHQERSPLDVTKSGVVVIYPDPVEMPLVCCNRECDCEAFLERRARWGYHKPYARKVCWIGEEDGLPICGKKVEGRVKAHDWHPSRDRWCSGCRRILEEHPEMMDPRVEMAG